MILIIFDDLRSKFQHNGSYYCKDNWYRTQTYTEIGGTLETSVCFSLVLDFRRNIMMACMLFDVSRKNGRELWSLCRLFPVGKSRWFWRTRLYGIIRWMHWHSLPQYFSNLIRIAGGIAYRVSHFLTKNIVLYGDVIWYHFCLDRHERIFRFCIAFLAAHSKLYVGLWHFPLHYTTSDTKRILVRINV